MGLRDHALVVGELAVDELGDELDRAEAEHGLVAGEHDLERVVVVGELAGEFEHGLARQDGFGALFHRRVEVGRGVGQAVAVGGDHAQLAAVGDDQQAVEVVADVLLRHRVRHLGELALEGALADGEARGGVGRRVQARVVGGGQGLELEAAAAGLDGEALVVEREADLGAVGQGAQDVLQLARTDGDRRIFAADVAAGCGADLDLDVGGEHRELVAMLLDQHVGQDRQRVALFDDAGNRLQRGQERIAGGGEQEHGVRSGR